MEYTVAQRVKGILVSSGHDDEKRVGAVVISQDELKAAQRDYEEVGRIGTIWTRVTSKDYFTSDADGEGAVLKYWGSIHREEERLRLYRLAIENCGFQVTEEADTARPGRRMLRVVRT